jgi:hypothetical protein
LVDFDKYIPKFCRTVVTDHGRLFWIAGRHQDNMCCNWMLEYIEEKKWLEHRAVLNDPRSDFTAIMMEKWTGFMPSEVMMPRISTPTVSIMT